MRLPPPKLADLLVRLEACSQADFSRAARTVQTLCRDLPDFDSVWLDALVQLRVLTPWQSEVLQSEEPDRLRIGRYLLRDVVGSCSYSANQVATGLRVAAVQIEAPPADDGRAIDFLNRLSNLTTVNDQRRSSVPASLILPLEVVSLNESSHSLIFPWVDGWSCDELLIRGGRLPANAVAEIGRELLAALVWLEGHQLLHGDITLRNVRLTRSGTAVLVCPFVRRLCWPKVSLTDQLSLRDCDGVAPEQIGTGRSPDVRSELHSLGCVLWQLLTSRPVVPDADPVSRLIKIRDQDVIDVRTYAPECPEWMARLILQMTRRSPELRTQSAAELLKSWRQHSGGGRGSVKAVVGQLPEVKAVSIPPRRASATPRKSASRLWPRLTAAIALLGFVIGLSRLGYLPQSLRWDRYSSSLQRLTQSLSGQPTAPDSSSAAAAKSGDDDPNVPREVMPTGELTVAETSDSGSDSNRQLTIPEPDADGVIHLQNGRTYIARSLDYVDAVIRMETPAGVPARIVVSQSAWKIHARTFTVRNVLISDSAQGKKGVGPGLLVLSAEQFTADLVLLRNSTFNSGIAWIPTGPQTLCALKRTILMGKGYGIRCSRTPKEFEFENCLFGSESSALSCEVVGTDSVASIDFQCRFSRITLKSAPAVFDFVVRDSSIEGLTLKFKGGESVLCPTVAVARIAAPEAWDTARCQIDFTLNGSGNPVIVPPQTRSTVFFDPKLRSYVEAPATQVSESSFLIAQPTFSGSTGSSFYDVIRSNELTDFEGPKLTTDMPGVRVSDFPSEFWQS